MSKYPSVGTRTEQLKLSTSDFFLSLTFTAATLLAGCAYGGTFHSDSAQQNFVALPRSQERVSPLQGSSSYSLIYSFLDTKDAPQNPAGPLLYYKGVLYGTSAYYVVPGCPSCYPAGTVFKITLGSQVTEQELFRFPSTGYSSFYGDPDGAYPETGVVRGSDGSLYGTAIDGGPGCKPYGCGTLFKLTPPPSGSGGSGAWSIQVLHYFGDSFDEGETPSGPLLLKNGILYGVATGGGDKSCGLKAGCGLLYSFDTGSDTYSVLHKFGDASYMPVGPLIADSSGELYGTTALGGASCDFQDGCGTVYELSESGTGFATIYQFTGSSNGDGAIPFSGVTLVGGNFYGTTNAGGSDTDCGGGCGAIFKLKPSGSTYTEAVVYSFSEATASGYPEFPSGLVSAQNGLLYGTTSYGGDGCNKPKNFFYGCGTLFSISTSGTFQLVYAFEGPKNDGAVPQGTPEGEGFGFSEGATPAVDKFGTLWGSTFFGGSGLCGSGCGAIYELSLGSGSTRRRR